MAEMIRHHVLARGTKTPHQEGGVDWPYEVALCFDPVSRPVAFAEGSGHCSVSGLFTAAEALGELWQEHIAISQGEWLRPYLTELAAGRTIERDVVLAHYRTLHGWAPPTFDIEASKI
jgi:hypothetical protein